MSDNLDDLILTDPEPETPKSKGILALLAIIVLLIVVGAVLAKMIFSSPDDDTNTTKNEPVKPPIVNLDNSNENNNGLSSLSETNADSNKSADVDADLTPLNDSAMPSNVDTVSIDDKADKKSSSSSKAVDTTSHSTLSGKELAGTIVTTKIKPGSNVAQTKIVKTSHQVKHIKHKNAVYKSNPKYVVGKNAKKAIYGGSGNTYIQVGSFSKGPSESFINKIRKAGFRYRIKEVNGFRRVLVGPFTPSRAKEVLGRVRSRISPSAFIKR